jgi:hypothetical protein
MDSKLGFETDMDGVFVFFALFVGAVGFYRVYTLPKKGQ